MSLREARAKPEYSARDISTTFIKGMAVLKAFDDAHTRLTLAEIAQSSGLDRASARRLTLTLVHLGYAEKQGRHFSLSPKVLTLAGSYLRGNRFGTLIQPLLNRCANAVGATVSLAILDEDAAVYVAQSTTDNGFVSFGFTVGSRLPLLHTAIGRMMLAYGDPDWARERICSAGFENYTPDTTTDRAEIARAVEACRLQGHAVAEGEFEAGVTGFAVPVGTPGALRAVVGSSRPTHEVSDAGIRQKTIVLLQRVAQNLARAGIFAGPSAQA